ncbi:hypothetical protein H2248_003112 [Termitomyces sp. 'cryptogamus']|nr:hypothetical protein H2248_003112 [Termitomyces sp. 'cryptogamus']
MASSSSSSGPHSQPPHSPRVSSNASSNYPNLSSLMAPTLGKSDSSLANSDGPLTNSNAFHAALNTSPASSESLGPSHTISDAGIHH